MAHPESPVGLGDSGQHLTFGEISYDDLDSLVAIRIAAMRESLERIGRFDPARARSRLVDGFEASLFRSIVFGGQRVGFFSLRRSGEGIWLDHLYIVPGFQAKGLGALTLRHIINIADRERQPIFVGALRESDSNRFYLRHGFAVTGEEEWDIHYVRPPRPTI